VERLAVNQLVNGPSPFGGATPFITELFKSGGKPFKRATFRKLTEGEK
jgi:hypothetical protein